MRLGRAMHAAVLTEKYFGPSKMLRYLVYLPMAASSDAIIAAFSKIGACESSIGVSLKWATPNPLFMEEVIEHKCYEPSDEFRIREDFNIIDAGANVGTFALFAAKRARKGRVIALEPNRHIFNLLRQNVKVNNLVNVTTLNFALGGHEGSSTFMETKSGGSLVRDYATSAKEVKAQVVTLEWLMNAYGFNELDFLKVDVEGAEFEAISNSSVLARVRRVAMEVHQGLGDINRLVRNLGDSGFRVALVPYRNRLMYLYAIRGRLES